MKITDAVWEKRNLGISCKEIELEDSDTMPEITKALNNCLDADYIVAKAPIQAVEIYQLLQQHGFIFVETMFQIAKELKSTVLNERQSALAKDMSYTINKSGSMERVHQEIHLGMFSTDRISLDAYFTETQAQNRYIGMLHDEMERGAELMEFWYQGRPFGFACFRKKTEERYHQCLTGLYAADRGTGKGFALEYLPEKELLCRKAKILSGAVSSNNPISLHAHLKTGFLPSETQYIFVKHTI